MLHLWIDFGRYLGVSKKERQAEAPKVTLEWVPKLLQTLICSWTCETLILNNSPMVLLGFPISRELETR